MAGNNLLAAKILRDSNTTKGGTNALAEQFPELYGAIKGLLGTAPDEVGGSVLDGSHQAQKAGAGYGFPIGLLANILPAAAPAINKGASLLGQVAEPTVNAFVARTMANGGKPAQLLQDMAQGTTSNAVFGGKYAPALDAKYGDKVDVYLSDRDGVTTISKIVVPKEQRNQGIGTSFMQDLGRMADKDGVTLALSPAGDFGGSVNRLNQFYRGQGFVPNKGRFKDFSISETMLRPPGYVPPTPNPATKTFSGDSSFFDAVGVNQQSVKADVDALMRKHPEFYGSHSDAADHVAHGLLGEPVLVSPASDPKLTLTVQDASSLPVPGGDDAFRSLVTDFGGKQGYQVRSAQGMTEAQLLAKKQKAKK